MFTFEKTNEMTINLAKSQYKQISSKEDIKAILSAGKAMGYNIKKDNEVIGFAMLRKYDEGCFFLWDFAIDVKYQNKHYGTNALIELISFLTEKYSAKEISTTYIYGNEIAARLYAKVGFKVTDVVDEEDCHEVNLELKLN